MKLLNVTLMKYKFFALMGVLALSAGPFVHAQDYDDIYYDGATQVEKAKVTEVKTPRRATVTHVVTSNSDVPASYKVSVQKNYKAERDVDEYNRRTGEYAQDPYALADTLADDGTSFSNTQRIERFYNPDVVVASNDADLIELYYDDTPNLTIHIGNGYYPYNTWGLGWTTFYDPWYSSVWYDSYYSSWYYRPRLWGYSYFDPWPWGFGWRTSWYGWHRPWYYTSWGWGHHWNRPYWGGHHWYGGYNNGRNHFGGHHSGGGRPGYATGSMGGRRPNGNHGVSGFNRNHHMSSGTRPGSSMGNRRPGYATGNVGTRGASGMSSSRSITRSYNGSRPQTSGSVSSGARRPGYATGSSSGTRSYSPSHSSSSSSRSYSPSHSSSSSSRSYSGGGRSYSGGGYSGGGHSGGGHSGGGGFSGGGGRRR